MDYYASGKLLLFGEYLVLNGANSLAIPLKFGQSLKIKETDCDNNIWHSHIKEELWFSSQISKDLKIINSTDKDKAKIIIQLLQLINNQKPELFKTSLNFKTNTNFPIEWGLGSSSTLISLLAQWSEVNPYELLKNTFGGSGYDLACAMEKTPIIYNRNNHRIIPINLTHSLTSKLLFIYSGKKQNSAKEVNQYNSLIIDTNLIEEMNRLVSRAIQVNKIEDFELIIQKSENLIAGILKRKPLKALQFVDYPFEIKSLGAWGGDFFMATFREEQVAKQYFYKLGYQIQFNYQELINNK